LAYWSSEKLKERMSSGSLVSSFDEKRITHCAYEMGVGFPETSGVVSRHAEDASFHSPHGFFVGCWMLYKMRDDPPPPVTLTGAVCTPEDEGHVAFVDVSSVPDRCPVGDSAPTS
jgi:hypothetical protein